MTIYYCVFILSFLLCVFDFIENDTKFYIYCCFVITITAIVGFRNVGVDNDSLMYQSLFENCNKYSYWQIVCGNSVFNREIGYVLLNKIVFVLGFDFRSILLFMSISSAVLTYSFIYKFSPYPFFSLLFYLSFYYLYRDFTQIRYGLCCGILFWAIYFYCNKKYFLFLSFWSIALLFHKTAFILLIVLPFLTLNNNKRFYYLFPIVCSIGVFFNFSTLFSLLSPYYKVFTFYYNEKSGAGLMLSLLGYIIMMLYNYLNTATIKLNKTSNYTFYFKLLSLGVGLNLLFFQFSVFQRFDYLFFQFSLILLPVALQQLSNLKYEKIYFRMAYFGFAVVFLVYGCSLVKVALVRPYTFTLSLN